MDAGHHVRQWKGEAMAHTEQLEILRRGLVHWNA